MTPFLKFIITGSALCLCHITRAQDTPQQIKGKKQWIQNLFAIVLNIKEIEKHVLIR